MGLLRFFLAAMVVWSHSSPSITVNSALLVPIFFLISGFYMALVLDTKPEYQKVRVFYFSRFMRLYPAYLVVFLFTVAAMFYFGSPIERSSGFMDRLPLAQIKENIAAGSFGVKIFYVFTNLTMIGYDYVIYIKTSAISMFDFAAEIDRRFIKNMPVGQTWSLGLEIWFYLLVPFFIRRIDVCVAVVAVSIFFKIFARQYVPSIILNQVSLIDFYLFFLGVLSYRFAKVVKVNYTAAVGAVLVIVLIQVPYATFGRNFLNDVQWQLVFLFVIALMIPTLFEASKRNVHDRFIGDLSYPIYLSHFLLDYMVQNLAVLGGNARFAVTMFLTIVFSLFLLRFLEKPIDDYRHKKAKMLNVS